VPRSRPGPMSGNRTRSGMYVRAAAVWLSPHRSPNRSWTRGTTGQRQSVRRRSKQSCKPASAGLCRSLGQRPREPADGYEPSRPHSSLPPRRPHTAWPDRWWPCEVHRSGRSRSSRGCGPVAAHSCGGSHCAAPACSATPAMRPTLAAPADSRVLRRTCMQSPSGAHTTCSGGIFGQRPAAARQTKLQRLPHAGASRLPVGAQGHVGGAVAFEPDTQDLVELHHIAVEAEP
jgi:hypothetical protein